MSEERKTADQSGPSKKQHGNATDYGFMEVVSYTGRNYLDTIAALNDAMVQLANEHMRANVDAARTLGQCQNLTDVMQVQSDLMKTSGEAYAKGWAKLMDTSSRFMSDSLEQFSPHH
jgi:hypothetical protein